MISDLPPIPTPGQPVHASWGGQVVEHLRVLGQPQTVLRARQPFRTNKPAVALTWSFEAMLGTLSAGLMIMRGQLIAVAEQSVTLSVGANLSWLQFSISPATTPTPTLHVDATWPTLDLGLYGMWPLASHTVANVDGVLTITDEYLYHPGGTVPYPI